MPILNKDTVSSYKSVISLAPLELVVYLRLCNTRLELTSIDAHCDEYLENSLLVAPRSVVFVSLGNSCWTTGLRLMVVSSWAAGYLHFPNSSGIHRLGDQHNDN